MYYILQHIKTLNLIPCNFYLISGKLYLERTCSAKMDMNIMLIDGVCRTESFGNGYLCMCGRNLCNSGFSRLKLTRAHVVSITLCLLLTFFWFPWKQWRHLRVCTIDCVYVCVCLAQRFRRKWRVPWRYLQPRFHGWPCCVSCVTLLMIHDWKINTGY